MGMGLPETAAEADSSYREGFFAWMIGMRGAPTFIIAGTLGVAPSTLNGARR